MTNYTFISWNIDSLNAGLTGESPRAQLTYSVVKKLAAMQADIYAIQETKLKATGPEKRHLDKLTALFPDYQIYWRSSDEPARKGYSGTLFLVKSILPDPIVSYPEIGAPSPMDAEGRIITLEFPDFFVTTVYTPNSQEGLTRLDLRTGWDEKSQVYSKESWDDKYRDYLVTLDKKKPVISSGDFNAAHREIDLANPKNNHNTAGFTDQERAKFGELLEAGFTDSFRHIHGDKEGVYTWFAQRSRTSKINNTGWRIDYYLVSERIADKVIRSEMVDSGERQDHVPILLEIEL